MNAPSGNKFQNYLFLVYSNCKTLFIREDFIFA